MTVCIAAAAIAGFGLIAGLGLAVASVIFRVNFSKREEEILELLPGANCGACSYAGCAEYAKLVGEGKALLTSCTVGGKKLVTELSLVMGVEEQTVKRKTAFVHCSGNIMNTSHRLNYKGVESCFASKNLCGGTKMCVYGCDGYGDCINACKFDAIRIINGIAVINCIKCVTCGKCIAACPKGLISLVYVGETAKIACQSHEKGGDTRRACKSGCIGCGRCVRVCPQNALSLDNNLAAVNAEKCDSCGKCAEVCAAGCIHKQ